ncbi:MAG: hypothetical protein Q9215_002910 [Flavoplaca cf. flavocitrina]
MPDSLAVSFLGALQASLSVLLTIGVGVLASQFSILNQASTKELSTVCVRIFLPCLLISNLGENLSPDSAVRYASILIWALAYTISSMLLGAILTKLLTLPAWVTPALSFNNTTSLPLLLVQSLASTGILEALLMSDTDTTSAAIDRAKSYFLVGAIVSNSLTFSLGPRLLDHEDAPDPDQGEAKNQQQATNPPDSTQREEQEGQTTGHTDREATEDTSLLPEYVVRRGAEAGEHGYQKGKRVWDKLGPKSRSVLDLLYAFLNAPLLGAVIGAVIGLTPPLQQAFFNDSQHGGFFNAWLTSCIKNVGNIFAALQVIVVGVKLSNSLRKMKRGEHSGTIQWQPSTIVLLVRFVIWPVISISAIYLLATHTNVLPHDPVLLFALMLMPAGPSAMSISSLTDLNESKTEEKMAVAKFLIIAYVVSPVLCLTVVGSLKATQAVSANR